MDVQEFGKENSQKIVLVPVNMMSWRQFEHVIPLLEKWLMGTAGFAILSAILSGITTLVFW